MMAREFTPGAYEYRLGRHTLIISDVIRSWSGISIFYNLVFDDYEGGFRRSLEYSLDADFDYQRHNVSFLP